MIDGGIQRSIFIVKRDGSIDFLINQKIALQESVIVSVLSRRNLGRQNLPCPGIEPGTSAWQSAILTTLPTSLLKNFLKTVKCSAMARLVDFLNLGFTSLKSRREKPKFPARWFFD